MCCFSVMHEVDLCVLSNCCWYRSQGSIEGTQTKTLCAYISSGAPPIAPVVTGERECIEITNSSKKFLLKLKSDGSEICWAEKSRGLHMGRPSSHPQRQKPWVFKAKRKAAQAKWALNQYAACVNGVASSVLPL